MPRKPPPKDRRETGRPHAPKAAPAPPETDRAPTLSSLRSQIDRLDKELVGLLNQRAEIAHQIGRVKSQQGLEIFSAGREDEVISKVLQASKGPLPAETIRHIYRELMSGSRAIQRNLRVACLGPKYSYSYLAAVAKFGEAVEHVPVGTIAAVFEEVNRRHVDFGVVPLENSTDGRVADTLDMFIKLPNLKIRAEIRLRVHHCLLGRGDRSQIRRVYSKAQALSQCRNWLSKNLPEAAKVEVVSTAAAAELAQREDFAAAIASRAAGNAYHLNVFAEKIEDQSHNVTRFAVIGEKLEEPSGRDKTTLMIRLANRPGALVQAITPFAKQGVNQTWIESFPIPTSPGESEQSYLFFIDVEGHISDPSLDKAIAAARKHCERLDVIGSYPRSESIET
jgi:chorismate mutase/prephenate dehydratase